MPGEFVERTHRCPVPRPDEIRNAEAGQGTIWACRCGQRYRLTINESQGAWLNLDNGHIRFIGWLY